jgi:hypothetical protein
MIEPKEIGQSKAVTYIEKNIRSFSFMKSLKDVQIESHYRIIHRRNLMMRSFTSDSIFLFFRFSTLFQRLIGSLISFWVELRKTVNI